MMLRKKAEDLKISLATQSNFRIIANLFINGKDYNIDLEFSENEINQVVKPLTERMIKPFVEVIKQSKVSQIDDLLLIGGSGRLWCVQLILQREMLKYSEIFKCAEISLAPDSDLIVSKGNVIYGKFYNDPNTKIAITNINSFHIGMFLSIIFFIFIKLIRINHIFQTQLINLINNFIYFILLFIVYYYFYNKKGVKTGEQLMHVMIPRGTALPYAKSDIFWTQTYKQEEAGIEIYEGNSMDTTENELIGSVTLCYESKADTIHSINTSVAKIQNDKQKQNDKTNNNKSNNESQSNKNNKTKHKDDEKSNNYKNTNNNNANKHKQNADNESDDDNDKPGWSLKIKVEQNNDGILYVTAKQISNQWNTCSMECLTSLTMIEHDKLLLINEDRKLINQLQNQIYHLERMYLTKTNREVTLTIMKYNKVHGNDIPSIHKISILQKYNNVLLDIYKKDKELEKKICTWDKTKLKQLHEIDYNLYLKNKNENDSENSIDDSDNYNDNTNDDNYTTDNNESDNEDNDNITSDVKLNVSTKITKPKSKQKSKKTSKKKSHKRSKKKKKNKSKKRKNRNEDLVDISQPYKKSKLD